MDRPLDWTLLQSFVAVAEAGSLTEGARATGASQPTMGRHIAALEARLGARLFDRAPGGLDLTETGLALLDDARRMAEAADHLLLAAQGRSRRIAGTIRITASEIMAAYVLPEILTDLRRAEPEIEIELVASDRTENLLRREADIAIRMYRPEQADVITRKVGEIPLGVFAADSYIARHGAPEVFADILDHQVVGYDRDDMIINGFAAAGHRVDRHFFAFRCDNQIVAWRMVVAGFGIGFNQLRVGAAEPRVTRVCVGETLPVLPIWLTAHAELKSSARIRRVYDFLADRLAQ